MLFRSFSFADYYDPRWMGFRSLRVINDDLVLPKAGFGTHPHHDMEIITYVLSGALAHKDSMGNGRTIRAGEFQYMAAGTGILHSEFNPSTEEPGRLLQIWITPDEKGLTPRYAERSFANAAPGVFHLAASKDGRENSMAINQDAGVSLAKLDSGDKVTYVLKPNRHAWLHVAQGKITLNCLALATGDAARISPDKKALECHLAATEPAQVLLFDLN